MQAEKPSMGVWVEVAGGLRTSASIAALATCNLWAQKATPPDMHAIWAGRRKTQVVVLDIVGQCAPAWQHMTRQRHAF